MRTCKLGTYKRTGPRCDPQEKLRYAKGIEGKLLAT
jgi:hypothetical protein